MSSQFENIFISLMFYGMISFFFKITVYDVERSDENNLEDTIVDAIIKGWSLKHIKDDQNGNYVFYITY